jgi:hypothetical protein
MAISAVDFDALRLLASRLLFAVFAGRDLLATCGHFGSSVAPVLPRHDPLAAGLETAPQRGPVPAVKSGSLRFTFEHELTDGVSDDGLGRGPCGDDEQVGGRARHKPVRLRPSAVAPPSVAASSASSMSSSRRNALRLAGFSPETAHRARAAPLRLIAALGHAVSAPGSERTDPPRGPRHAPPAISTECSVEAVRLMSLGA